MHGSVFRVRFDQGLKIERRRKLRRRKHRGFRQFAARLIKRHALPLADLHVLIAHLHIRGAGRNGNLIFIGGRVGADRRTAVFLQGRPGIGEGDFGPRFRRLPRARRQVYSAGTDVYGHVGLVAVNGVLLHGDERVRFDRVGCAVHKRQPGRTVVSGANQIAFVERGAVIGTLPGHRIGAFDFHLTVKVNKTRLILR